MTDFRMLDLQKRINKLFKNFEDNSKDKEDFLISLERLIIIERVLKAKSFKDFKKMLRLISFILKLELWKKPVHSRIRYLRNIIED